MAEQNSEDVYGTFNLLMRRKPKENNFKAVLESIRDLMNENYTVPSWLHDILLGYGDPAAAQYQFMEDTLQTVDFKDTFLDAGAQSVLPASYVSPTAKHMSAMCHWCHLLLYTCFYLLLQITCVRHSQSTM